MNEAVVSIDVNGSVRMKGDTVYVDSIAGYSNLMPRAARPETSPNGSMNTVVPPVASRKADWPYHSTCM